MNHPEIQPRGKNTLRALPVVLAAIMGAASARGQAAAPDNSAASASDDIVTMDVFEVKTDSDVGYMSQNAAEVTRMNTAIEDIPMNITVFNQQFIEDIMAVDTSEVIAYDASSVKTHENDAFIARGFTNPGSSFLNGFAQVTSQASGGTTTGGASQPMANIERIEVIRGPAAILFGAGAYGATYNRITKRPRERPFTNVRTIFYGSGLLRGEFDNSGPVPVVNSRKLLYRINGVYEDGESWFGTRRNEKVIAPSLSWQIGTRARMIFEYFYNFRETQAYFETPVLGYDPNGIRTLDGVYHSYGDRRLNWATDDDFRRQRRQFVSYDFRLGILKNLHFRSQFQHESKKADFAETFVKADALVLLYDAALLPRYWREWKQYTKAWRSRNELVWDGRTGPFKHQLLAGFGWVREETDEILNRTPWNNGGLSDSILDELGQPALSGDGRLRDDTWTRAANPAYLYNEYPGVTLNQFLADPTLAGFNMNTIMPVVMFDRSRELSVPRRPELALYPDRNLNRWVSNTDWYANDMISFAGDRIILSGGLRYIEAKRRNINRLTGAFPKNRVRLENPVPTYDADCVTTYSGGLVWHIDGKKMFTLYGNLNSSFAVEWRTQPDGAELKPERGRQKEAGLRINAFGGRLAMLATYFDIKQENVTQADPNRAANSGWYVQLDGVRSQGFELSVNARVTRDWNVMAGYAYTDARQSENPANPGAMEEMPRELVPNNRLTLRSQFDGSRGFLRGWRLGCGIIYTGSRPLTMVSGRGANISPGDAARVAGKEVNWGPLAPQWNVDASLGYRWKPRAKKVRQVETILRVKNLFNDTDLFYVATTNRYTVDPGRECQFLFAVRF